MRGCSRDSFGEVVLRLFGIGKEQRVNKSLQESREARQGRGEWDYGKHSFHVCLHRGGRGGAARSTCYNKFFLLYVRSWERIRELEGRKEGNFWTGREEELWFYSYYIFCRKMERGGGGNFNGREESEGDWMDFLCFIIYILLSFLHYVVFITTGLLFYCYVFILLLYCLYYYVVCIIMLLLILCFMYIIIFTYIFFIFFVIIPLLFILLLFYVLLCLSYDYFIYG